MLEFTSYIPPKGRPAPLPNPIVDPIGFCRWIRENHQHAHAPDVDGDECLIDAASASLVIDVYDKLNPLNKAKFLALPGVPSMARLAWRLL